MHGKTSCACNRRPCVCSTRSGDGCITEACVPRPTFFDGQLIGSEDLNAIVRHFRTRDMLLGRYAAGWGVYGGLVVDAAPGVQRRKIGDHQPQLSPNPQVIAGTTVEVSPGLAIDAHGRMLVHCAPTTLDLAALAAQVPTAVQTYPCREVVSGCQNEQHELTGRLYYLVAEYAENPGRPAPQYSGGGACDPAPTCEFSRMNETVKFSLVPASNIDDESYPILGCLDMPTVQEDLRVPDCGSDPDTFSRRWQELMDFLLSTMSDYCCSRPVVVLCRVLLTSMPSQRVISYPPKGGEPIAWTHNFASVPNVAPSNGIYTILDNAYPVRRIAPGAALTWQLMFPITTCRSGPTAMARLRYEAGRWDVARERGIERVDSEGPLIVDVTLRDPIDRNRRVVHVTPWQEEQEVLNSSGWMTTVVEQANDPDRRFRIQLLERERSNPPNGLMVTVSAIGES